MYQQINLYQPVFRQKEKIFSSQTLLIIWGLVFLLLIGLFISQRVNLSQIEHNTQLISDQFDQLNQQFVTLMTNTDQTEAEQLEAEIEQLQLTRDTIASLLNEINGSALPTATGFSLIMEALAKQRISGVWLTGIEITADGTIRISGKAANERLVPRYMQQLSKHASLADKAFTQIQLTADESTSNVNFILQSGGQLLP